MDVVILQSETRDIFLIEANKQTRTALGFLECSEMSEIICPSDFTGHASFTGESW